MTEIGEVIVVDKQSAAAERTRLLGAAGLLILVLLLLVAHLWLQRRLLLEEHGAARAALHVALRDRCPAPGEEFERVMSWREPSGEVRCQSFYASPALLIEKPAKPPSAKK